MSAKTDPTVISGKRDIIRVDRRHAGVELHHVMMGAIYTLAAFAALHLVMQVGHAYLIRDWTQASLVALLNLQQWWPKLESGYPELLISVVIIAIVWISFSWLQVWKISLHRK